MAVFLPRRWNRQPTARVAINWRNPLAQKLMVAATPTQGYKEIVSGLRGTPGPSLKVISTGKEQAWLPSVEVAGGLDFGTIKPYEAITSQTCSFLLIAAPRNSGGSQFKIPFSIYDSANAHRIETVFNLGAGSGDASAWSQWYSYAAPNDYQLGATGVCDGTFKTFVNVRSGDVSGAIYVDGVAKTNSVQGSTNSNPTVTSAALGIGNMPSYGGSNGVFDDPIVLAVFWNRALRADEAAELSVRPWQIFIPVKRVFYSIPASTSTLSRPPVVFTAT